MRLVELHSTSEREERGNKERTRIECETWLRVFENRIFWQIFGTKSDDNGKWRKLHNEELHSFYRSLSRIRIINLED
jgi:hypothetical protein